MGTHIILTVLLFGDNKQNRKSNPPLLQSSVKCRPVRYPKGTSFGRTARIERDNKPDLYACHQGEGLNQPECANRPPGHRVASTRVSVK